MYRRCCIPDCSGKRNEVLLHKFPKTEIGLKKWVECINSDNIRNRSAEDLQKLYVCHRHFEKRLTSGKFLRHSAYPSLFTEEEIETGIPRTTNTDVPSRDVVESEKCQPLVHVDHDYTRKRKHDDHTYSKHFWNPPKQTPINIDYNAPSTSGIDNKTYESFVEMQSLYPLDEIQPISELHKNSENETEQHVQYAMDHNEPSTSGLNIGTPKKCTKRKRVVQKLKVLSPRCRRLYKEYTNVKRHLHRAKQMQMSKEQYFEKLTDKLNPLAKKLFWLQIKMCTKNKKGRRYSEDEKLIALAIMKQSPKSYRFLQRIFILPSKSTLNKMIRDLRIESGVNAQIFSAIKKEVQNWPENKKYCSILFDEVALEPGLSYDKFNDSIAGFVELRNKKKQFADHALVFMIRGALHKWQQPICFYFCAGATSAIVLKGIIKEVTKEVINSGLVPVAFVSDQGSAFRSALKSLQEETKRQQVLSDDTIKIGEHNISILFDPPHLIKGLRNNFLNKNISYNEKLCTWSDIIEVYQTDCKHTEMRLLHKLNDEHVIPDKIKKMKVKNCTRVFSKTVAAALAYTAQFSHYIDGREVSSTLKNTSELISFLDDLFDSCNGSALISKNRGKPLRAAVTDSTGHVAFWEEAIKKLENMKFIDKSNKICIVPSQKNFVITLKSLRRLWNFFKAKGCRFIRPRYFNSDPIENFFGQVRAYNFRNNDPSCQAFKQIFRSLLITRFINFHSDSFNCEDASGDQILKLKNLLQPTSQEGKDDLPSSSCEGVLIPGHTEDIQAEARRERLNVHSRAYTVGWVIRKCLKKIKCKECTKNMCQKEISPVHKWISHREFKGFKNSQKLTYPSENAVRSFGNIVKEANEYLETKPHSSAITGSINNIIISKYSFDFLTCKEHRSYLLAYFISIAVKLTVINWCSVINRILKGVDILRLENSLSSLPCMQNMALNKYKKKLKNKKINK